MYVGCKNHKTESLRKLFSSISKGLFVCILLAGCAERPPSAINPENTPPTVTIISPAEIDAPKISAKTLKDKPYDSVAEADVSMIEKKGVDRKSLKKTAETGIINEKDDTETTLKSAGAYKKGLELIFEGLAVDVEGDPISESSLRWTSDKEGEIGKGYSFTKSDLSAGEHQIVLTATDSEGGVGRDTVNITIEAQTEVLGNKLPVVKILSLEGGWSLLNTTELILRGVAEDFEDGELEGESLVWKSSKDGVLGTGSPLDVTGKLSLGDHTITFMGTDSNGNTGEVSVDISITNEIDDTINNSPIANILNVDDILTLLESDILSLEGSVSDPDEDIVKIVWSSDIDGELGRGTTLEIPAGDLTLGEHRITFTATDDDGATGSDNIELTIHKPPVADIIWPAGGEVLLETDDLILEGSGSDPDPNGEIVLMEWSSDIDGELGTGNLLKKTGELSIGEHTIILTVTDSEGATASDQVTITVNLAPPTNLTAEAINSSTVRLRWQDNSNSETHFNIEMRIGDLFQPAGTTGENVASFDVTDLQAESLYEFRVYAENNNGISDYSNFVEATTLPAQITRSVTADNTLDSRSADENILEGTLPVGELLELENEYRAALQFAELQDDIPGRTIERAVLRLNSTPILDLASVEIKLAVNAFVEQWDPNNITWSNHLEKYTSDDQSEQNMLVNVDKMIEFDITPIVKNWADGRWDVNGLLVRSLSGLLSDTAEFESLESGESEGLEPVIIVDFAD